MDRRNFVKAGLSAGALGAVGAPARAAAQGATRQLYEMRSYELRNDIEPARATTFFREQLVPALKRAGAATVGVFTPENGLPQPSLVALVAYPSLAALDAAPGRMAADRAYQEAVRAWEGGGRIPYVRYETALYRAFAGHPRIETAAAGAPAPTAGAAGDRSSRLFELRTYEAPNETGLRNKIEMFNTEEIRIFRASGINPVWFGEAIAGTRLPHLSYMVAYDDMAARGKAWSTFGSSADWQRIRSRPGWTDPEAVSSIRAAFLRATEFSDVK